MELLVGVGVMAKGLVNGVSIWIVIMFEVFSYYSELYVVTMLRIEYVPVFSGVRQENTKLITLFEGIAVFIVN